MKNTDDTFLAVRAHVIDAFQFSLIVILLMAVIIALTLSAKIAVIVAFIMLLGLIIERAGCCIPSANLSKLDVERRLKVSTLIGAASFALPIPVLVQNLSVASGFVAASYGGAALILQVIGYSRDRTLTLYATVPHALGLMLAGISIARHYLNELNLTAAILFFVVSPIFIALIARIYHELSIRDQELTKLVRTLSAEKQSAVRLMHEAQEQRLRAEAANIAKTNFLATMSHEVRTPMNGIIGLSDLMASTHEDDGVRRSSVIIRDSAENLLTIMEDVLDFSKLDAGKLQLESRPFSLPDLFEKVSGLVQPMIDSSKVRFSSHIGNGVPERFIADERRLRQVVLNLLGNAAKFTHEGAIMLNAIRLENETSGENVMIRISVADTGIGMDPTNIDQMFERFTQASSGTTREYGGVGLGLAICKEIVKLMGGEIKAQSEFGKGSIFYVDLSLKQAFEEPELSVVSGKRKAA